MQTLDLLWADVPSGCRSLELRMCVHNVHTYVQYMQVCSLAMLSMSIDSCSTLLKYTTPKDGWTCDTKMQRLV